MTQPERPGIGAASPADLDIEAQRRLALFPLRLRTADENRPEYREAPYYDRSPRAVVTLTRAHPTGFAATVRRGEHTIATFEHHPARRSAWPPSDRTVSTAARRAIVPDVADAASPSNSLC